MNYSNRFYFILVFRKLEHKREIEMKNCFYSSLANKKKNKYKYLRITNKTLFELLTKTFSGIGRYYYYFIK